MSLMEKASTWHVRVALLKVKGVKQVEISRHIGINNTNFNQTIRGKTKPSLAMAEKVEAGILHFEKLKGIKD